jgi:hypothetical protein
VPGSMSTLYRTVSPMVFTLTNLAVAAPAAPACRGAPLRAHFYVVAQGLSVPARSRSIARYEVLKGGTVPPGTHLVPAQPEISDPRKKFVEHLVAWASAPMRSASSLSCFIRRVLAYPFWI